MIDLEATLRLLSESGVDFIVVGGAAATAHGSARLTNHLNIVYSRTPENIRRLVSAIAPQGAYLRGAPPGLPFRFDEKTIERGLNFTLTTTLGNFDILGEITGGGRFEDLLPHAIRARAFGVECLVLGLDRLIHVKRAAGRPKDLEVIAELEALREERDRAD